MCDGEFSVFDGYIRLAFDEMAEDLWSIAILKTTQLLGQHIVQSIGNHGHYYIEVYFNQDRRRKGIKVKKLDCFRNDVFYPPTSGVVTYEQF